MPLGWDSALLILPFVKSKTLKDYLFLKSNKSKLFANAVNSRRSHVPSQVGIRFSKYPLCGSVIESLRVHEYKCYCVFFYSSSETETRLGTAQFLHGCLQSLLSEAMKLMLGCVGPMGYLPRRFVGLYPREKCVPYNKVEKLEIFNPLVIRLRELQNLRYSLLEFCIFWSIFFSLYLNVYILE